MHARGCCIVSRNVLTVKLGNALKYRPLRIGDAALVAPSPAAYVSTWYGLCIGGRAFFPAAHEAAGPLKPMPSCNGCSIVLTGVRSAEYAHYLLDPVDGSDSP